MADYVDVMNKLNYLDDTKVQIKDAIIEKGQQIEDEASFREYVEKILNIDAGKVKLYNSEAEMYADTNVKVDDIALVYNTIFNDITYRSSFDSVAINKHLTLGASVLNTSYYFDAYGSGSVYGYNSMYVNASGTDGTSPAQLQIYLQNDNQTMRLNYISIDEEQKEFEFQNGYIDMHSGSTQELIFNTEYIIFDFSASISWRSGSTAAFSRVFKVKDVYFGGIFQFKLNQRQPMTIYLGKNPNVNGETGIGEMEWTDWVDLTNTNYQVAELMGGGERTQCYGICVVNETYSSSTPTIIDFDVYDKCYSMVKYNNKVYPYITRFSTMEDFNTWLVDKHYYKLHFNTNLYTYEEIEFQIEPLEVVVDENIYYYAVLDEIPENTLLMGWVFYADVNNCYARNLSIVDIDAINSTSVFTINMIEYYTDKYMPAKTQLTVTDNSYLLTGKTAYGKAGIYTGDGTYLKHTTTREFRDFFMPQMPDTYDNLGEYGVIQYGQQVPYYTFVNRKQLSCSDVDTVPPEDSIIAKLETLTQGTYESELYNTIYNSTYHRTFYCEDDDRLYFGYFGYNMSDKQSSSSSGGTVHEDFQQIYGLLICLNDMTVYRTCNYTTTWRPFNGWGNYHEDPNANLAYLNYDFINDEFVAVVDTGSWAWTGSSAPFLAMLKINGTTGVATPYRWQIGRNGVPNDYAQVTDVRYDITTKKLVVPLSSWNKGSSSNVERILKMDLNGNKSIWVQNGYNLNSYSYLGDEESFYTLEPIYYYSYTDGNSVSHYVLKRIDDDRQLEIPYPYGIYNDNMRYIYNGGFYFFNNTQQESGKYPVYRVDLSTMTYEKVGEVPSYSSSYFILYNKIPHIIYNNYIHSIDDIEAPIFLYYNSNKMYNDVRVDGIEVVDGNIQGMYPKASTSSSGISYYKIRQVLYHYHKPESFRDITDGVCMVWPTVGSGTYGSQYMYYSILIGMGVAETLTQEEFDQTKALVESMLGGTQQPSPEIEYINECNELANDINGE